MNRTLINNLHASLPDTKPPKYIPQKLVVGDFAGYGAQAVEGGAQVG